MASAVLLAGSLISSGCRKPPSAAIQGYVEGEFVQVAAPSAGQIRTVAVQRGTNVKAGDLLFALENTPEQAAVDEARERLAESKAMLEDSSKGRRPTEIAALEAQQTEAAAMLEYSMTAFAREEKLRQSGANALEDLDRARTRRDQDRQRLLQIQADLATAKLGGRPDALAAAAADVQAREAAVRKSEWSLQQTMQKAPKAGLVFDVLYREGEWLAAGKPAVMLLPPENIKVRAFVPEPELGRIRLGQAVSIRIDGAAQPVAGTVSFISPQAEFNPPVIFSEQARSKLVFLVEIRTTPELAAALHPGQPVDVEFAK